MARICRSAQTLPVLVAPTVGFGFYPAFVEYPASQHIPARQFEDLLVMLMRGLIDHGVSRLLMMNGGVSTETPVTVASHTIYAETGVRPTMVHLRLFGRSADTVLDDASGGHASERETSVMLALRPGLVDLAKVHPAPADPTAAKGTPSGVRISQPIRLANDRPPGPGGQSSEGATGSPTLATAAKALLFWMPRWRT